MRKEYDIGGRKFYQDKLVLGQIEHLVKMLQSVGEFKMDVSSVIALVTKRYDILTVVMVPEGETRGQLVARLDNGGTKDTETFLRDEMDWETLVKVATDFFDCNPVSALSSAVMNLTGKLEGSLMMPSRSSSKASTTPSREVESETVSTPASL